MSEGIPEAQLGANGKSFIDMGNGEQVELPDEFKNSGKVGFDDVFQSLFGETNIYNTLNQLVEDHVTRIAAGDTSAMLSAAVMLLGLVFTILVISNILFPAPAGSEASSAPKEEPIVERDFTMEQLRDYTGGGEEMSDRDGAVKVLDENHEPEPETPIYVALKGVVYDVSSSRSMYGKGAGYHCFAGRESTRAMAKFSFEEADLADPYNEDGFGMFERNTLDEWIMKFEFKYPKVGRVSQPPRNLEFTKEDLAFFRRDQPAEEIDTKGNKSVDRKDSTKVVSTNEGVISKKEPSAVVQAVLDARVGRIDQPILIGVNGQVLDVSYGGKGFYGGTGPYSIFAGKDITRALATMSLKPEDVEASNACPLDKVLEGLTENEIKIMKDWETKFIEKRKYPVIGRLVEGGLL